MSKISPSDIAVSVRERLLNVSRKAGDPFDLVLTRYALERLLYRIGGSPFADRFIVKIKSLQVVAKMCRFSFFVIVINL